MAVETQHLVNEVNPWLTIIPVLIGGLLAIIGGVIGNYFAINHQDRLKNNEFKKNKIEELISTAYKLCEFASNSEAEKYDKEISESKIKYQMLSNLYFPSLSNETGTFLIFYFAYLSRITGCEEPVVDDVDNIWPLDSLNKDEVHLRMVIARDKLCEEARRIIGVKFV